MPPETKAMPLESRPKPLPGPRKERQTRRPESRPACTKTPPESAPGGPSPAPAPSPRGCPAIGLAAPWAWFDGEKLITYARPQNLNPPPPQAKTYKNSPMPADPSPACATPVRLGLRASDAGPARPPGSRACVAPGGVYRGKSHGAAPIQFHDEPNPGRFGRSPSPGINGRMRDAVRTPPPGAPAAVPRARP
jgi:hypothetical protein